MHSRFNEKDLDEIEIIDDQMYKVSSKYNELKLLADNRKLISYFIVYKRILNAQKNKEINNLKKSLHKKITSLISVKLLMSNQVTFGTKCKIISFCLGDAVFYFYLKLINIRYIDSAK